MLKELERTDTKVVYEKEVERLRNECRDQKRRIQEGRSRIKAIKEEKRYA